jgi:hypothetical protein
LSFTIISNRKFKLWCSKSRNKYIQDLHKLRSKSINPSPKQDIGPERLILPSGNLT